MRARVKVFAPDGVTPRTANVGQGAGILPTIGLQFSVEVGGGGGATFQAIGAHLDTLQARDSVIRVQVENTPGVWTDVAAYTLRPPFRNPRTGRARVDCTAVALLDQWASETVILPEYTTGTIPRGSGTDRGLGWMMTAYNPDTDTNWVNGCYEVSRATYPTNNLETGEPWPSGSGAKWISITGATDTSERKLFRTKGSTPLTITTAGPIRVHVASDSPGDLYIAGEIALSVEGGEPGKEPIMFQQADMYVEPGQYAVAFDTASLWDTGGDGVDPCIIAICTLDADSDPATWLVVSGTTKFTACRRNDEAPGDAPPGPTPGALLAALLTEAQDRNASGWSQVVKSFTTSHDTYGVAWPDVVVERMVRYASGDTYQTVFNMLAESLEVDVWLDPDLILNAAPKQGQDVHTTVELVATDMATFTDTTAPDEGTWMAGLGLDGWVTAAAGTTRREVGYEFGTAVSMPVAVRMIDAALAENGRWDGSIALAPDTARTPLIDFQPGDLIGLDYPGAPTTARVLSMSASAGKGGLRWDLEVVNK